MKGRRGGVRILRAAATNLLAAVSPRLYLRLARQTGRGGGEGDPAEVAAYFRRSFAEYFARLGLPPAEIPAALAGRTVLEYGPGDIPGVALLCYAYGARRVHLVDRFPLLRFTPWNEAVLRELLTTLPPERRRRGEAAFRRPGEPAHGLRPACITYRVTRRGRAGLREAVDFVFSRAVLELVPDLEAAFRDMAAALRPGGVAVHRVDLRSHGFHWESRLDFLTWPEGLWRLMHAWKGPPNRLRADRYRELPRRAGLEVTAFEVVEEAPPAEIAALRPRLARPFRDLPTAVLACLDFWLVLRKPGLAAAGGPGGGGLL